jgi:hypothetical protein
VAQSFEMDARDKMSEKTFPALNPISLETSKAVLTHELLDNFAARLNSPEYAEHLRRAEEERGKMLDAVNRQAKEYWANHLGKAVDELTREDLNALSDEMFHVWLKYKGITEEEFMNWIG